ncbi:MAG: hypothetical protein KAJ49_00325 [Arcobacteraceae bacterium]|nr:hypothetical protein [Arcobacteraceae bacterium]
MCERDIKKEFSDVTGLNEAKKVFKKLARLLHPDIGGDEESFKILKNVYDDIVEHKIYFSTDAKFDIELEKIISQILHFEDIIIEVVGSWIWLSGETKIIKDTLKNIGFKWASKKKMWYYGEMKGRSHKEKSLDEIKGKYGCETVRTKQKKKLSA